MTTENGDSSTSPPLPTAPSTLQRWFPIVDRLPKYDWSSFVAADLIAAASVAALLIPQSMGYASVYDSIQDAVSAVTGGG